MQTTKNLGLKKPEPEDFYNVQDQNTNMDIIDEEFGGVLSCVLSTAEPSSNNTLWLYPKNTTTSTSELVLGDAAQDAEVQAEVEGTSYAVQNVRNTQSSEEAYSYEII